jgi:SOS-response transcriptional repressor LexA
MSGGNNLIFVGLFMIICLIVGAIAGIPAIVNADEHIQTVQSENVYGIYNNETLNSTVLQTESTGIPMTYIIGAIVFFSAIGILYLMMKRANKFVRVR